MNDIEVACGLSCKELIHHVCSHPLLRMVEHKIQRSDDVGQKGMAPHCCARRNCRLQSAECRLATTVEDGDHDKRRKMRRNRDSSI